MRIIAGEYRSRRLLSPDGLHTRPMPDRVRESVFGMLGVRVEGAAVVDLFSGSGAIGLEALSRGAASSIMVDNDKGACQLIQRNIESLQCADRARAVQGDALGSAILARCPRPIDLVFLDPPYPLVIEQAGWDQVRAQVSELAKLLAPDGFIVLRTPNPFLIATLDDKAAAVVEEVSKRRSPAPRKGKKPPKRGRERWDEAKQEQEARLTRRRPEGDVVYEIGDEPLAPGATGEPATDSDFSAQLESAVAGGIVTVPGDLTIEGTRGPETHVYGSTAVHWYMRANA